MRLGIALPEGAGIGAGDLLAAVDALPFKPSHVPVWCRWDDPFPFPTVVGLMDRGIEAVIFWEPVGDHEAILNGTHDAYLRRWAVDANRLRAPVIVRFAHEQNAPWMPWGIHRGDNDAASYVAMWRHVVRVVRRHTDLVRFLWCPDASHVRHIAPTWPGDRWVDLAGLDGYRWPGKPGTPAGIFGPALRAVRKLTARPLVIAEFAIAGEYPSPVRRRWMVNAVRWFRAQGVHAAIWFDIDMRGASDGRHPDWRLGEVAPRWDALVRSAA